MGPPKRDDELIWSITRLFGLVVALVFVYPVYRHLPVGFGSTFALFLVLAVVGVLVLSIFRLLVRRGKTQTSSSNVFAPSATLAKPTVSHVQKPSTTEQLIQQLRSIDWFQFEQLVAHVYREHGYTVSRRGGANPDGGIDLVIEKDGVRTAVQCKHWKTWRVGVKAVREFLGALTDSGIQHGVFVTLGECTGDARQLAAKHGIEFVKEAALAGMLESTDASSDPAVLRILQNTRKLCPKCEREMVLRTASKGTGAGNQFWGCSGYPRDGDWRCRAGNGRRVLLRYSFACFLSGAHAPGGAENTKAVG
jgi:restriction system protein